MKILKIITGLQIGGAERIVCDLADDLSIRGHSVDIMSITGEALFTPKSTFVKIIELKANRNFLSLIKSYLKARKIIKYGNYDIVHSHMFHANMFARALRITIKINKLVCTAHSTIEGGRLRCFSYRISNWLGDIFTNVSQEAVESFEKSGAVKKGKMIAIHNGINTNLFKFNSVTRETIRSELNIHDSDILILAVGRLVEPKDYENLLVAFSIIIKEEIKLFIIGDGPLKEKLLSLAIKLKIEANVKFLGIRHDVASYMCAADVFVLSSAWEGFGLVVAEAMACQRTVVATDCGGLKEVLGDYGFLVETKNSKKLADAINSAIHISKNNRYELGKAARDHILKNFSLANASRKFEKIYQEKNE